MGLTNTTYTLALVITLLYWIFVFPKTDAKEPADAYLNIVVHLFQVIIILIVGQSKLKTRLKKSLEIAVLLISRVFLHCF